MKSARKSARAAREQLLTLVNGWDPAERLASGAPRNVYDAVVDELLAMLSRNASNDEIAAMLTREIRERYRAEAKGVPQFVKKAATWFELASREEA